MADASKRAEPLAEERWIVPLAVGRSSVLAATVLVIAALMIVASRDGSSPDRSQGGAARTRDWLLPDTHRTPGAARILPVNLICGREPLRAQPIPEGLHERVFRSYGADPRRASDYELDHLITPELGGMTEVRNLWPQPYGGTPWNAYVKDELEELLHKRVCQGSMGLSVAQGEIAADWIGAYKRYFQTDTPRRDHSTSSPAGRDITFLGSLTDGLRLSPHAVREHPALMALGAARHSVRFAALAGRASRTRAVFSSE